MKNVISKYKMQLVKEKDFPYETSIKLNCPKNVEKLVKLLELEKEPEEVMIIIALSNDLSVIGIFEVSRGIINASLISPREIFKRLIVINSANFIAVHNHPSGNVCPSDEDNCVSNRLQESGELLGISLVDFGIVGDSFYSFKDHHIL